MSDINPQDKAPLTCSFAVRVRIGDVEGELTIAGGTLKEIRDAVKMLPTIKGVEVVQPVRDWQRTPEGEPICPKHGAVMPLREKQGDTWHSHNVGTEDTPIYCRGYASKNSPGWDYAEQPAQAPEKPANRRNGWGLG